MQKHYSNGFSFVSTSKRLYDIALIGNVTDIETTYYIFLLIKMNFFIITPQCST